MLPGLLLGTVRWTGARAPAVALHELSASTGAGKATWHREKVAIPSTATTCVPFGDVQTTVPLLSHAGVTTVELLFVSRSPWSMSTTGWVVKVEPLVETPGDDVEHEAPRARHRERGAAHGGVTGKPGRERDRPLSARQATGDRYRCAEHVARCSRVRWVAVVLLHVSVPEALTLELDGYPTREERGAALVLELHDRLGGKGRSRRGRAGGSP